MDNVNRDPKTSGAVTQEQNMKTITRFDMIENGTRFQMTDWTERGIPVETVYVKTSTRKACRADDNTGEHTGLLGVFAVKPTARVTIEVL